MNPYFWLFAVYAVLITPVTFQGWVRLEKELDWQLQIRIAGMPLLRVEKTGAAKRRKAAELLAHADAGLLRSLLREGDIRHFFRAFQLERLDLYLRLSLNDAALTAMLYAAVRTLLHTLAVCGALPRKVGGRVEADFELHHSQMNIGGIFACRLGKLGLAAIRLGMAVLRQKRLSAEEETYAAASH